MGGGVKKTIPVITTLSKHLRVWSLEPQFIQLADHGPGELKLFKLSKSLVWIITILWPYPVWEQSDRCIKILLNIILYM